MKVADIKMGFYKVIFLSVKFHNHSFSEFSSSFSSDMRASSDSPAPLRFFLPGAQTSIIQSLQYFEHLSEPMAELLSILDKEFDFTQLTEEVLRFVSSASSIFVRADPDRFSLLPLHLSEKSRLETSTLRIPKVLVPSPSSSSSSPSSRRESSSSRSVCS